MSVQSENSSQIRKKRKEQKGREEAEMKAKHEDEFGVKI